MARCFIGIIIPEGLKGYLEGIEKELSSLPMTCKFVEKDNFHLCLSFLGEVEEGKIKGISEALDSICSKFSSFEMIVDGIKMIPSESYARVLALDVADKTNTIGKIMDEIKKEIGGDSHPPHLTLCRVKSMKDKQQTVQKIKSIRTESKHLAVSSIQLIKSELKKTGPVYSSVHDSKLR
ncbi:MAG TPA: RNA 2',3'-cyclic phosphodiesterase [archaeon]|nr:RNA 2',3'-cyclic phosphodiesterase [archaeon]